MRVHYTETIFLFACYTGGPGPQIFIDIDNFEAGSTHILEVTLGTESGQSATDTVQFVAIDIPEEPST